jgi:quercetin dioxygenase-like cupin family protein
MTCRWVVYRIEEPKSAGGEKMKTEPLFLRTGETCLEGPLNLLGDEVVVKLGGTSAQMTVMLSTTAPKVGPPLHRHSREDEAFFVLEGTFLFEADGKQTHAGPGCFMFLPCGTAHAFQNVGETPGKMLILAQPAGVENFFSEIDRAMRDMKEVDMNVLLPIFAKYGMEFLGPPIGARPKS